MNKDSQTEKPVEATPEEEISGESFFPKKQKKEYLVLGILLLALVLYLFLKRENHVSYTFPSLKKLTEKDIDTVTLRSGDQSIEFKKSSDETWRIRPEGYEIEKNKFEGLLNKVLNPVFMEITALDKKKAGNLDLNKTVLISGKGRELRRTEIGKSGPVSDSTYAALQSDPRVFLIKGSFEDYVTMGKNDWRSKEILPGKTLLKTLKVTGPAGYAAEYRWDDKKQSWSRTGAQKPAEQLNENKFFLKALRASGFWEGKPAGAPLLTLDINKGEHLLRLYPAGEKGYPLLVDQKPSLYLLGKKTGDLLLRLFSPSSGEK